VQAAAEVATQQIKAYLEQSQEFASDSNRKAVESVNGKIVVVNSSIEVLSDGLTSDADKLVHEYREVVNKVAQLESSIALSTKEVSNVLFVMRREENELKETIEAGRRNVVASMNQVISQRFRPEPSLRTQEAEDFARFQHRHSAAKSSLASSSTTFAPGVTAAQEPPTTLAKAVPVVAALKTAQKPPPTAQPARKPLAVLTTAQIQARANVAANISTHTTASHESPRSLPKASAVTKQSTSSAVGGVVPPKHAARMRA
jgi:hypothetical protein